MNLTISIRSIYGLVIVTLLSVSIVESYGIEKITKDTSRRNLFQTTKNVAIIAISGTVATIIPSIESVEAATEPLAACPPRSQNCIRTSWKVPSGTKDAYASVVELFKSYPQEGQGDVDKGGWTIVDENSNNNTLRLEYKSGIGNFAKFFNGAKPFIDDVVVQVNDNSIIEIRSSSRIGESDLGVNQKRLQFLANKARDIGWDAPDPKY
jgi:uncharacterized protein (DUF1499 family)